MEIWSLTIPSSYLMSSTLSSSTAFLAILLDLFLPTLDPDHPLPPPKTLIVTFLARLIFILPYIPCFIFFLPFSSVSFSSSQPLTLLLPPSPFPPFHPPLSLLAPTKYTLLTHSHQRIRRQTTPLLLVTSFSGRYPLCGGIERGYGEGCSGGVVSGPLILFFSFGFRGWLLRPWGGILPLEFE